MLKVLLGLLAGLALVMLLQTWNTLQQDAGGAAKDFADQSTKSAELYRKCVDEKDEAACVELEQMSDD